MTEFALSSAWHAPTVRTPRELLDLPARLGFDAVELSSVGSESARAVRQLAGDAALPVISLHAPCPVPYPGASRLDELASPDEGRRAAAVDYTRQTIDLAVALKARFVVLHLGSVEGTVPQRAIFDAIDAGETSRWRALLAEGLARRKALSDRYFDRCVQSLEELVTHAAGSGVRLGAETRYHYHDLPDLGEFATILRTFGERGVGYWHDTGHAHLQEMLGLAAPGQYLERYGEQLLGFHLNDVRGTHEHFPPGEGEVDFAALRPFVRADCARVLEVASGHTPERVAASLRFLRELGL